MIVQCPSCAAKYKYDESKLGDLPTKKVRCPKCKTVIEIVNTNVKTKVSAKEDHDRTFTADGSTSRHVDDDDRPPPTTKVRLEALVGDTYRGMGKSVVEEETGMPQNKKLSLALIGGSNPGSIYPIVKTITII